MIISVISIAQPDFFVVPFQSFLPYFDVGTDILKHGQKKIYITIDIRLITDSH